MIEAKKSFFAEYIFSIYIKRLFKKHFNNLYLVNEIDKCFLDKPLLITPNHFSWWDGFFVYILNKQYLKKNFYILMLEEQLKRYWFFRKLGAFSINSKSIKSIGITILYLKKLLNNVNNVVFFYPQGEIVPYEKEPIEIKNGIKYFLGKDQNNITIPISFRVYYSDKMKPDVLCKFGKEFAGSNSKKINEDFSNEFSNTNISLKQLRPNLCKLKRIF